jgi:hypothetical protein
MSDSFCSSSKIVTSFPLPVLMQNYTFVELHRAYLSFLPSSPLEGILPTFCRPSHPPAHCLLEFNRAQASFFSSGTGSYFSDWPITRGRSTFA